MRTRAKRLRSDMTRPASRMSMSMSMSRPSRAFRRQTMTVATTHIRSSTEEQLSASTSPGPIAAVPARAPALAPVDVIRETVVIVDARPRAEPGHDPPPLPRSPPNR